MKNKYKYFILFVVSILPLYPAGIEELADPKTIEDERVNASITNEELKEIIIQVRKPSWGGLYGLLFRQGKACPITGIYRVVSKITYYGKSAKIVYPVNVITVITGDNYTYEFHLIDGRWKLVGSRFALF